MLDPETRHLLTDALRPPDGYAVEIAVATTYTLDLTSVLLAPLAMAAYDQSHAAEVDSGATPLALLESIRRHAEHTTVLCQAAAIHVPSSYPKLAAFAEGCVAEVAPPPGRTFHPKLWLLRFRDGRGNRRHRFVCLSRNLTSDRSWDTVLVCDEDLEAPRYLDAAPIGTFVTELLGLTVRPLDVRRREQVLDLCATLSASRLALPEPFTSGQALPLGTPSGGEWPLPAKADTVAVISPFLDATTVARLPRSGGPRLLVSRSDTLERLGTRALEGLDLRVLQPIADAVHLDDFDERSELEVNSGDLARGLHAKVFAWESDGQAHVLSGSANCTGAAFGGNIELSVLLSGPPSRCGVRALLGDDTSGFLRLTQNHVPSLPEATSDLVYTAERRIEAWHARLAGCLPRLVVTDAESGYDLGLEIDLPDDPDGLAETTTVRPVGIKTSPWKPLAGQAKWRNVGLAGLTPYLAVSTTVEVEGVTITPACVLVCDVLDAPEDRLPRLLRELLANQEDVLRYLALLLGDATLDDFVDRMLDVGDDPDDGEPGDKKVAWGGHSFHDLVLVEPLIRAAARGDDSLLRAHKLLEDLRDDEGDLPDLGTDFVALWQIVWEGSQR